jgi:prepilin-type N-terminal cleavage/methylation domain-containing protein
VFATHPRETPVPRRRGFTLIEVLIVIVILGVLAAIAIPKYSQAKAKAYFAVMRTDLRNVMTAQEAYRQLAGTYYAGPIPVPGTDLTTSAGVTITLSDVTTTGWAATATHASATGRACAVYDGTATPPPPATAPGEIACR